MIYAHQQKDGSIVVVLDAPEQIVVSKLADAYCLSGENMLIAIINRGMDSIGKSVTKAADPRVPEGDKNTREGREQ